MAKLGHNERIGILGGTFDPVHFGHLVLGETARVSLGLDKVIFIPARRPPHKKNRIITDARLRYKMVRLAIEGNKHFCVSKIEIKKKGFSYSVETLIELKKTYPRADLYFIIGSDALCELKTWKRINEIFSLCSFAVAIRPDFKKHKLPKNMLLLNGPFLEISGSCIRKLHRQGRPVRYLMPEKVCEFIQKYKLYR